MDSERLGDLLATLNAILNGTSAVALFVGFVFIRRGAISAHRAAMLMAVATSALFLVSYVTRFLLTGTHRFAGEGLAKTLYLGILFSHMVLAVAVVPLVLRLLYLAHHERFESHRRLARWTFPIWAYVSLTGLVVYILLYHVYGYV